MQQQNTSNGELFPALVVYCRHTEQQFNQITPERKEVLLQIAVYMLENLSKNRYVQLNFICVQNSRRSHFGQVWAKIASLYYGIKGVDIFSGGTEVSALNTNAAAALQRAGIQITKTGEGQNPGYTVHAGENLPAFTIYSKLYDDVANPQTHFAAVMVCGEGDEECPLVNGADKRFLTPYPDPKKYDDTEQQDAMYDECCRQIAREVLFVFSFVKQHNG
jgi:arsenate reductase (thioredoxin)